MKRSPLRRRTPLHTRVPKPRPKPKPTRRATGPRWAALREVVLARAGHRCERCGEGIRLATFECHHRRLRSQGGRDVVENLVAVCPDDHRWIHAHPTQARADGWIVPGLGAGPHVHPECVPITLHDGRMVLLDPDAGYEVIQWPAA